MKITENLEDIVEKAVTKDREEEREDETPSVEPTTVKPQEAQMDTALRLLEADERQVVTALIEAGGSMLQKEITWKSGFSRVKTHRILVRLLRRGVVTSEKYYNTNKITLAPWLFKPDHQLDD